MALNPSNSSNLEQLALKGLGAVTPSRQETDLGYSAAPGAHVRKA